MPDRQEFHFTASLWRYKGQGAWYFITVPQALGAEIRFFAPRAPRGFGSLKVEVSLGGQIWQTSLFPDSKSGSFLLPIKSDIRKKEQLIDGQDLSLSLRLL